MINRTINTLKFIALFVSFAFYSCKTASPEVVKTTGSQNATVVSKDLKWSDKMALTLMKRHPESWQIDDSKAPKWDYVHGLVLYSFQELYKKNPNPAYASYVQGYLDALIENDGTIKTYEIEKYNIDMIVAGRLLFNAYDKTKEEKYLKAMQLLRQQLTVHPRTQSGGFWHKKIYPNQMWLDGLYMGQPFYAHYTKDFTKGADAEKAYDDIINQFDLIQKHLVDKKTGLLYHAWDESKEQAWANKETGLSPNFWGRAMGWYGMAMVDVLDYLPKNHPGRAKLISYIKSYTDAIIKVQDKENGLWYQVLDKAGEKGNYTEATASAMFVYTIIKSVNNGYLPKSYKIYAQKGYDGIIKNLITVDENGVVNLNKCCAVAGLGGKPYRDGSYEYYVNEQIRSNDAKGTGPFILASLEFEKTK